MKRPSEFTDPVLGRIVPFKKGSYTGETRWNRGKTITFIIHAEGRDPQQCFESASRVLLGIRKKEASLLRKSVEAIDSKKLKRGFLKDAAQTSIEIFTDDEVHIAYLIWKVGTLFIRSTRRGRFLDAEILC